MKKEIHLKFSIARGIVQMNRILIVEDEIAIVEPVSYTHLDVYKRQVSKRRLPHQIFASKRDEGVGARAGVFV